MGLGQILFILILVCSFFEISVCRNCSSPLNCCGCGCCAAGEGGECLSVVVRAFCLPNTTSCANVCHDHTGVDSRPCTPPLAPFGVPNCNFCSSINEFESGKPPMESKVPSPKCSPSLYCCPCRCCDEGIKGNHLYLFMDRL